MTTPTLYIGDNFSDDPAGRYYTDGDGSGEEFREEVLKPLLSQLNSLEINIDKNVEGYGSSFLVEAFGGLVKHGYFTKDEVNSKINISYENSDYEFYKRKIIKYINESHYNSEKYVSSKESAINSGVFKETIDKSFVRDILNGTEK
ncbi:MULTISPECIES: STAS-like domain-containing protein [Shewanella]|uniref:STAS-like domain-containing protein n=1 Tax=Shewanella TaxID=22 RepID=UPI001183F612|nr:STAS-like domain-containing protein [Shewanella algae]MBO2617669.1 STAS-like domain-containing protein [Shewanella algae]